MTHEPTEPIYITATLRDIHDAIENASRGFGPDGEIEDHLSTRAHEWTQWLCKRGEPQQHIASEGGPNTVILAVGDVWKQIYDAVEIGQKAGKAGNTHAIARSVFDALTGGYPVPAEDVFEERTRYAGSAEYHLGEAARWVKDFEAHAGADGWDDVARVVELHTAIAQVESLRRIADAMEADE